MLVQSTPALSQRFAHTQSSRNGFAHHAEPGSLSSQLVSYTYPPNSNLINSRHFYQNSVLMDWVKIAPRPVSLRQLAFFGRHLTAEKLISSANFVQHELPTRIAHRIRDMQVLPFAFVSNYHMCKVYEMYYEAFDKFRRFPKIKTLEENDQFCLLLNKLLTDHLAVIPQLVMGAIESSMAGTLDSERLDDFMSSILRSRISRRVIAEQHLALTKNFKNGTHNKKPAHNHHNQQDDSINSIGAVFLQCSAMDSVRASGVRASHLIQELYPDAVMPEVIIEGLEDAKFPYMKSHLDYILGELLRNSIEATVSQHYSSQNSSDAPPPPVVVSISSTHESVLIRISDQGGGVPADVLPYVWSFAKGPRSQYRLENFKQVPTLAGIVQEVVTQEEQESNGTTNGNHSKQDNHHHHQKKSHKHKRKQMTLQESLNHINKNHTMSSLTSLTSRPPQLKLGMGLPLSKIYVEYWDGHIDLHSLEGYGCDVYLRISRLGNQSEKLQLDRV